MTGDWLAAFESLTPVTVIVPEYFSAKAASIVVCTESLATVRRSAIADFPWAREGEPLENKYFYTTHSELNAILNYRGGSLEGATMYVTLFPCNECAKAIIQAGIKRLVYDSDKYNGTPSTIASRKMLSAAGVDIQKYEHTGRIVTIQL